MTAMHIHTFDLERGGWAPSEEPIYYDGGKMARGFGFEFLPSLGSYWAVTGKINGCGACRDGSTEAGVQQRVSSFAKSFSISGICRKWAKVSRKIADATASRGGRRR